ncbi:MAG: ABC transporter permease [Mycobacteriaceae bacterium]
MMPIKSEQVSLWRTVLAMRVTLYKRQFSGGTAVVKVLAGLLGLIASLGLCLQAALPIEGSQALIGGRTALVLASVGLMWALMPVLSGISENSLQPRHFQLLSVNPQKLATALLSTSMLGIVVPVTVVASAVIPIYALMHQPSALIFAVIAWPATVLLFVLTARVLMLLMSQLLKSRRSRELALLVFSAVFASLYLLQYPLTSSMSRVVDGEVTWPLTVAHSIPFAWGVTSVDAVIDGHWVLAALAVLGLIILDMLLLFAWQKLVLRYFDGAVSESVGATAAQIKNQGKDIQQGWRASRLGAVVSRELSLWRGDIRRRTQLLSVVIMALLSGIGPLLSPLIPFNATWGAWIVLFAGMAAGSDMYGFDGKSLWHIVMIPEAIKADVRGRQIVWLLVIAPFAVSATVVVRIFGDTGMDRLAVPLAITVVMFGVGGGLAMVSSALAPYPVPEASKTFSISTRNSFKANAFVFLLISIGILLATTVPCALLAALLPEPSNYVAVLVAAIIGAVGFWWGGQIAIKKMQKDADLIFAQVSKSV